MVKSAITTRVEALFLLGSRLKPAEAAGVREHVTSALASALDRETDREARERLMRALASVAGRMEPGPGARTLVECLAREKDFEARDTLTRALVFVSRRMSSTESDRLLTSALEREKVDEVRITLADAISTRIGSSGADRICSLVIRSFLNSPRENDRSGHVSWELYRACPPRLLRWLDRESAHVLAWESAAELCSSSTITADTHTIILAQLLNDVCQVEIDRRATCMALAAGDGLESAMEAMLRVSAEPFPCRLTTQELVELLKMPTCFGHARRVVLDQLGNRYGRRFVNHWAFVRYAREHGLRLDLTTPARRTDPRESLERVRRLWTPAE